jgi:hypothetical protein
MQKVADMIRRGEIPPVALALKPTNLEKGVKLKSLLTRGLPLTMTDELEFRSPSKLKDVKTWLHVFNLWYKEYKEANMDFVCAALLAMSYHVSKLESMTSGNLSDRDEGLMVADLAILTHDVLTKVLLQKDERVANDLASGLFEWSWENYPLRHWASSRMALSASPSKSPSKSPSWPTRRHHHHRHVESDSSDSSEDNAPPARTVQYYDDREFHDHDREYRDRGYDGRGRDRDHQRGDSRGPHRSPSARQDGNKRGQTCFKWNSAAGCDMERCPFQRFHGICRACGGQHKMADARKCAQRLWCKEAADIISAGIDPIFGTKLLAGRFQDGSLEQKAQEAWHYAEQDGKCRSAEEAKANRRAA